jgi:hypothetical protein
MPANYAHYRFGAAMLGAMPGDIRRTADRFRRLYDAGLHGPDIFFYYNPLRRTEIGSLGRRIHRQPGRELFGRICRNLRLEPSREMEAYLYGLLCHYVLDSACHPFIVEQERQGLAEHIELETEFDRFLLDMDGKIPAENQDISPHMRLNTEEFWAVARCYPGVTERAVGTCLRHMMLATKALAIRSKGGRELLKKGMGLANWEYRGFVMTDGPNPRCSKLDGPLYECYRRAEERFPALLMELSAHLAYNAPLGADFSATFG